MRIFIIYDPRAQNSRHTLHTSSRGMKYAFQLRNKQPFISFVEPPQIHRSDTNKRERAFSIKYVPMNRKNIRSPNSRMEALRVLPNICKPFECLDSLNILNTLTSLITLRMAKDMAWLACLLGMTGGLGAMTSSFSATMVARVMKYGMIATRSIMFIMSLLNSILLGHARNLTNNSNVNQIIHNVSTIKNGSVTSGT